MAVFRTLIAIIIFTLSTLVNCIIYPFSKKLVFTLLRKEATLILKVFGVRISIIRDDFSSHCLQDCHYLFISNHQSVLDILVLLALQPRPAGFIAKKELFHVPLLNLNMRMSGSLSIDRNNLKKAYSDVQKAVEKLRNRQSLHMFPEGTRNTRGGVLPLKKGFLRIARQATVPVVPVIIHGTANIMRKHSLIPTAQKGPRIVRIILEESFLTDGPDENRDLAEINAIFQKTFNELEKIHNAQPPL